MIKKRLYQWAVQPLQGRPRHRGRCSGRIRSMQAAETGLSEMLESRILLSASTPVAGLSYDDSGENDDTLPWDGFDDDEDTPADEPVEVAGCYCLTSQSNGNTRAMFFDDVKQGQLNTCTFASVLAAASLTTFNLEGGITFCRRTRTRSSIACGCTPGMPSANLQPHRVLWCMMATSSPRI